MKLVVIGGVAGGASVACRVRRLDEQAEIVVLERGRDVSYSNCSLPYYLSGIVEEESDLVMMTPKAFKARFNIDVRTNSEAVKINRSAKTVTVTNVITKESYEESYDILVLSPGASPVIPADIEGTDRYNVFTIRNVTDIAKVKACMDIEGTTNVAVLGGGFVGIETAENLRKAGKNVTVIGHGKQIMSTLDYDMVQMVHKELADNGVHLLLNTDVKSIDDGFLTAIKAGKEIKVPADAVIISTGIAPETKLAKDAGLEIGKTGGISVDKYFRTSDVSIYAVGDAIESYNAITGSAGRLALAGPAQRQARAAANHICGKPEENTGFIGSSCAKIFDLNTASTGLNEKSAKSAGLNYDSVMVIANDKVGLMPDSHYLAFKLLFEVPTGKILGAQAIGKGEADKRIDIVATLISMGGTVENLKNVEHCYAPPFSTAKDVVHMGALVAENVLNGNMKQVHVSDVRKLYESDAYIVDVREKGEFAAGHIKNAHNVPLSSLREHIDEIPRDVPVYLHCRSSQRSYYAYRNLVGNGYDNIFNISGSYLGISLYEYFNDVSEGRESILTAYNFN